MPDNIIMGMPMAQKMLEIQNVTRMESSKTTKNEEQGWSLEDNSTKSSSTIQMKDLIEDVSSPLNKTLEDLKANQAIRSADQIKQRATTKSIEQRMPPKPKVEKNKVAKSQEAIGSPKSNHLLPVDSVD
ncbi:hypothetical protein L7F22_051683, partial [Adiantum nelumboides]|nr:hypothetical protein [Adiantum nelumboides]